MPTKTMCIRILDVCYSDAFLNETTIHMISIKQLVWDDLQIQIVPIDLLPHGFWIAYKYLTKHQSEDSHAHLMVI